MTFWDHVEELRKALLRMGCVIVLATFCAFVFHKPLFHFLYHQGSLYLFSPLEGFRAALKVSFWTGFLFSSPIWLLSLLRFILPALHTKERQLVLPFVILSFLFITGGILFAYTVTLPLVTRFFLNFNQSFGENLWGLSETIDFTLSLLLAHGLTFELYVGLLFLIRFDLLRAHQLKRGRRYAIVCILILSAILTPPDILSQILLACPLFLLYETAVFYAARRAIPQAQINNLSFGLSSSDTEEFAPQKFGFSGEANGQRPFASLKSTRAASKIPEDEGEKPKTQVNRESQRGREESLP